MDFIFSGIDYRTCLEAVGNRSYRRMHTYVNILSIVTRTREYAKGGLGAISVDISVVKVARTDPRLGAWEPITTIYPVYTRERSPTMRVERLKFPRRVNSSFGSLIYETRDRQPGEESLQNVSFDLLLSLCTDSVYFLSNFRSLVCRPPMTFDKYLLCRRYRGDASTRRLSPARSLKRIPRITGTWFQPRKQASCPVFWKLVEGFQNGRKYGTRVNF